MTRLLWTQRTSFGPGPRGSASAAFDSARNRTVLFGGNPTGGAVTVLRDTWEWDGSYWTQMQDIGPPARSTAAMVYDSARQVSILFGGVDAGLRPLGDTWQWDGTDWTQLADSGPSPRFGPAMAFDSVRKVTVLFAGATTETSTFSDTWEFDGSNWTQQEDSGPSARYLHAMAFDGLNRRSVVFGGRGATNITAAALGDTWAWDGSQWVQIAEFGPTARFSAAMASAGGANLILYGGLTSFDEAQPTLADTWEFDGRLWTQRQDIGPGPLQQASAAFDGTRKRIVLYGGVAAGNTTSGATWESNVPDLQAAPPVTDPSNPGGGNPGSGNPGSGNQGSGNQGSGNQGSGNQGTGNPGSGNPGSGNPGSGVRVASLSILEVVRAGVPLTLNTTLSGPAPAGGLIVNYSGPARTLAGAPLTTAVAAAGSSSITERVAFDQAISTTTLTAQTAGTPAVSLDLSVQP